MTRNPVNIHPSTYSNRKCSATTSEEQAENSDQMLDRSLEAWKAMLPWLLERLSKINDPRRPGSCRHKLVVVLFYGMLLFVLQYSSRRKATNEGTEPSILEKIQIVFPQINSIPHMDTVERILENIPHEEIEAVLADLIARMIRNKQLVKLMVAKGYLVAFDGSGKHSTTETADGEGVECPYKGQALTRKSKNGSITYIVYVLEAVLVSPQGVCLPIMCEFCENGENFDKQDCESKAFRRLAKRFKDKFPRLPVIAVLDGLYANGPIISLCQQYNWDYMIVLKDDSLKSVHKAAEADMNSNPGNKLETTWGTHHQVFRWANVIEYVFKDADGKIIVLKLHVVECVQTWQQEDKNGQMCTIQRRWVWISGKPITRENVAQRCNEIARSRWGIENVFHTLKHRGYSFEHMFSEKWNAMIGWHTLMRLAHVLNVMTLHSAKLAQTIEEKGFAGTLAYFKDALRAPRYNRQLLCALANRRTQLRLSFEKVA